jgi:hypothetical protein
LASQVTAEVGERGEVAIIFDIAVAL